MPGTDDRLELAPRAEPGALRAFGFALLVHLLLMYCRRFVISSGAAAATASDCLATFTTTLRKPSRFLMACDGAP